MFEIGIKLDFSAAHRLRGYRGTCEAIHGHNWDIEVFLKGRELDAIGILVDFRHVRQVVKEILEELDHRDLNDVSAFRDLNPTSENIARHLFREAGRVLNDERVRVSRVTVYETPRSFASYTEDDA